MFFDLKINLEYQLGLLKAPQSNAFKTGKVTAEQALKFEQWEQVRALETGKVTAEEALKFGDYILVLELKQCPLSKNDNGIYEAENSSIDCSGITTLLNEQSDNHGDDL